jgi:hypothetical protein
MTATPDDELEIAQPDDFLVQRDDDDNLQPITQQLPGVEEHIRVVPMTMGDLNAYGSSGGQLNPAELGADEIATLLNEHWYDLRTSERELTPEDVHQDMIGFGRDALVTAILRASGYDLQQGLNMEQLEMLEQVPEGKLETMMDLAERRG